MSGDTGLEKCATKCEYRCDVGEGARGVNEYGTSNARERDGWGRKKLEKCKCRYIWNSFAKEYKIFW